MSLRQHLSVWKEMKSSQGEQAKPFILSLLKLQELCHEQIQQRHQGRRRGGRQALEDGGCQCVLDGGHHPEMLKAVQTVEAEHGVLLLMRVSIWLSLVGPTLEAETEWGLSSIRQLLVMRG